MNVLITGINGQLGSELKEIYQKYTNYNFYFTDVDSLDITNSFLVDEYFVKKIELITIEVQNLMY